MELSLSAVMREGLGKEKVSKLRQDGQIPGVLYGEGVENQNITMNAHELNQLFFKNGTGKLISLNLQKGKTAAKENVLVKEFQRHPVKGNIIHIDFLRVNMEHLVTVHVPVHMFNEEKRAKDGAILELLLHVVEISCLPGNIPDRLKIDVSKLALGAVIHVKDLVLPEGAKCLNALEEPVIMASAPTVVEAVEPAADVAAPTAVVAADPKKLVAAGTKKAEA